MIRRACGLYDKCVHDSLTAVADSSFEAGVMLGTFCLRTFPGSVILHALPLSAEHCIRYPAWCIAALCCCARALLVATPSSLHRAHYNLFLAPVRG
jgi:hypothetical protein